MSGVYIMVAQLKAASGVTALVNGSRIMAGDLPVDTVLPAISVSQISSSPRNIVAPGGRHILHTDRVQVTALVKDLDATPAGGGYESMRSILKAVLAAGAPTRGTVAGVTVDSILPDIEGPDFFDMETGVISGSRDFLIRWLEA